ncbi:DUF397 domain-containing protein [Spiractinospora alimapuensis]|uniref:DUF397 domain-containing protein n=1 Tax=Spiractinospora alimapuensis TaxID=2820884 RepID=UPI001F408566|nr:DUF397 domain-containing protein [Spiractinospora alimapuensis]QVQ51134.1 DUF397 domain-containing protein [Spiractinospora alimapuensis]
MRSQWHKSSYSGPKGDCVECRGDTHQVLVRDTQHRHLGHLTLPATEWQAFLHAIRNNEFG